MSLRQRNDRIHYKIEGDTAATHTVAVGHCELTVSGFTFLNDVITRVKTFSVHT
jgi:hypothetical protein